MRPSSLAFRLTVSAAIVSLVLLVSAGLLLSYLFQVTIERNFDARLQAVLDGLLANVEVNEDGAPVVLGAIADTRFKLPLSGWYWQVSALDGRPEHELVSESLLDNRLRPADLQNRGRDDAGLARFYLIDQSGTQLRGIEQRFRSWAQGIGGHLRVPPASASRPPLRKRGARGEVENRQCSS